MRWVLVVLLAVAMVAAGCSGDDDDAAEDATTATTVEETEVLITTLPPAEVSESAFTFADDDLCEWVSEDEVAEFVAAEFEWDGTAVLEGAGGPEDPDSCAWRLTSTAGAVGEVTAGNAGTWVDMSGYPIDVSKLNTVDFDAEVGYLEIGSAVSGHPSLTDGVVVYRGGFGRYAFSVPPIDQYLSFPAYFLLEESDDGDWDEADYEARFFGVADRFVQELGWLG